MLNCLIKCVLLQLCLVSSTPRLRVDCSTYDRSLLMLAINSVSHDAHGEEKEKPNGRWTDTWQALNEPRKFRNLLEIPTGNHLTEEVQEPSRRRQSNLFVCPSPQDIRKKMKEFNEAYQLTSVYSFFWNLARSIYNFVIITTPLRLKSRR